MFKKLIFLLLITISTLYSEEKKIIEEVKVQLNDNALRISEVDTLINRNGFWVKRYFDHQEYNSIKKEIIDLKWKIRVLKKKKKTKERSDEIKSLVVNLDTLESKLSLLGELGENPYAQLIKVDEIPKAPEITNPFSIMTAFSYISDLNRKKSEYAKKLEILQETIESLEEKRELLNTRIELNSYFNKDQEKESKENFQEVEAIIDELTPVLDIFKTTLLVHNKKSSEIEIELKEKIKEESIKSGKILLFIFILLGIMFLIKMIVRKTVEDSDRVFNINRVINISGSIIVLLTLTFNYINNLTYFVTVLGFVSAGIAIAMKDWFMNILGWFVIVLGGSIHVGDRIKITRDGNGYVGDVLEISLTRVTFFEDITLTSYEENRRTGRVIMFPNNFIFDSIILNYTFSGLKTVWDGVDIMVTFDSNHKKAVHIAKEIVKKYSKGYTDITRKQINELRGQYHIRNFNAEPRVFTFIEEYGMKISSWYLTNSYATLTLRSTISSEIVDAFNNADDITIAYPSQTIMLSSHKDKILEQLNKEINNA